MIKRYICPCCGIEMVESEENEDMMYCERCGTKEYTEDFARCECCDCYVLRDNMVSDREGFLYCSEECRDWA